MSTLPTPRMLSLADVASAMGVCVDTVSAWMKRGDLVAVRVGRKVFITQHEFDAFLERKKAGKQ